jgi:hypothetical protein
MNKRSLNALLMLALTACAHIQALNPWHQSEWDATLSHAGQAVEAGNYFTAEKLLDEYVRQHPGTREASEIAFWKAAYEVDPANSQGSLSAGIAGLDAYLSANPDGLYRNEATVLRRTAAAAEGIANRLQVAGDTTTQPTVRDTVIVVSKSRDEQIAALKDQLAASKAELAKVSAELDRIKKRLANPSN